MTSSRGIIGHHGIIGMKHAALPADDLKRVMSFYTETLEFRPYYIGDKDWAMVSRGGTSVSFVKRSDPVEPHSSQPTHASHHLASHLGFTVSTAAEVDAFHARVVSRGIKASKPKRHRDGSYGFYFEDTEGNNLELIFIPHTPYLSETPAANSAKSALILLSRGSKDPVFRRPMESFLDELQTHLPTTPLALAYTEFGPNLESAFTELLAHSPQVEKIQVAPLFMTGTAEVLFDIPSLLSELNRKFPKHRFVLLPPVGEASAVRDSMLATLVEAQMSRS